MLNKITWPKTRVRTNPKSRDLLKAYFEKIWITFLLNIRTTRITTVLVRTSPFSAAGLHNWIAILTKQQTLKDRNYDSTEYLFASLLPTNYIKEWSYNYTSLEYCNPYILHWRYSVTLNKSRLRLLVPYLQYSRGNYHERIVLPIRCLENLDMYTRRTSVTLNMIRRFG